VSEVLQDLLASKESKAIKGFLVCPVKREIEVRLEILVRMDSQGTTVSKEKTDQLVYPVCQVKWALEVFLVNVGFLDFPVHLASLVVKALQVQKVIRGLLEHPAHPVRQDPQAQLALQDRKVHWGPLVPLDLVVNQAYLAFLVPMDFQDLRATQDRLVLKETLVVLGLKGQ